MSKIGKNDSCPCGSGRKYKKCCELISLIPKTVSQNRISTFPLKKLPFNPDQHIDENKLKSVSVHTERCVISVETNEKQYKLFQIVFAKDGSLFVNFPYFKHKEGLVTLATIPANISYPTNVELNPGGKATTHLVKYTHHPDGEAHFSQDGRVFTHIRKKAVPLTEFAEHIFTIKLQDLSEFESKDPKIINKKPAIKRTDVNIRIHNTNPEALKIVGRWYSKNDISGRLRLGDLSNNQKLFICISEDGKTKTQGILLRSPFPINSKEYFLMLTIESIPKFDKNRDSSLTFIGGFDSPNIINDLAKETTFLAFTYPITDIDNLTKELGSIDFRINK